MDNNNISVQELENEIAKCFEMREAYERKKSEASELNDQFEIQKSKVVGMLEKLEKTSYKSDKGTFSYSMSEGFRVPKTPEQREKFFGYLKEKGIFDEMITVNSQTLNSWAKIEIERALEENNFDFQVPGLERSEPQVKVSMRMGKA